MRIQSSHKLEDRGLDAYFTPIEAVTSLIELEQSSIPAHIWEPAAGDGAIVHPLKAAGYKVQSSDIADYGLRECKTLDYLKASPLDGIQAIITNPPFRLAMPFAEKALKEVSYLALLLRTNFLESTSRMKFFRTHEPSRIWISSRRLPMMHRYGWTGPQAPSNTCHAWFIWDKKSETKREINWFDWKLLHAEAVHKDILCSSPAGSWAAC